MGGAEHRGHCHAEPTDDEGVSTGFLPISLAVVLMVSGLFVFGVVPTSCDATPTVPTQTP